MIEAKASNNGNHWKFEPLFTSLNNDDNPKFITKGPNRYLTSTPVYMEALGNWIDFKKEILSQLASYGFPKKKITTRTLSGFYYVEVRCQLKILSRCA